MKHFRGDLVRLASSSWGRNAMAWRIRDMFVGWVRRDDGV